LAVIFGLMGIVNFAHGAFYTPSGRSSPLFGLQQLGINYWAALVLAPIAVGLLGVRCGTTAAAAPVRDSTLSTACC
jgi:branched-chain amino acid transport system permease protein